MKSKVFISVAIPDKIKKRLLQTTEKWQDLPIKWVREANIHMTLVFLGFVDEEVIPEICEKVSAVAGKRDIFDFSLDTIEYFPSESDKRAIALTGPLSEDLKNLVNDIEQSLGISSAPKKSFRPHITLGRIRQKKWSELDQTPEIREKFFFNMTAESVSVMASNFSKEGSEYSLIENCPLK